jgi:glycerol uptake facilitator-like aquaporin
VRKAYLAEFLGSLFLMISAIAPTILFVYVFDAEIGLAVFANAIAVAWVLAALIEIFMPISGAHFNPIVTLTALLGKKITPSNAAIYTICQILGGLVGVIFIHLMFIEEFRGVLFISEVQRSGGVYFAEFLGAFVLILVILMLGKVKSTRPSIIVAFLVGGMIISTPSTFFANPQVTFARVFTSSVAGIRPLDAAIFIAVQIAGAVAAFLIFKIFSHSRLNPSDDSNT